MSDPSNPTDNFAALFEQSGGVQKRSGPAVKVGARVEAVIVQITRDAVFVTTTGCLVTLMGIVAVLH